MKKMLSAGLSALSAVGFSCGLAVLASTAHADYQYVITPPEAQRQPSVSTSDESLTVDYLMRGIGPVRNDAEMEWRGMTWAFAENGKRFSSWPRLGFLLFMR